MITVNGKIAAITPPSRISDIVKVHKPFADIFIVDGGVVTADHTVYGGENIVLITRGEIPPAEEMETMLVSRHTPQVHNVVKRATVGIAGLGGLGSNIAVSLVRMGIGAIVGADFDVVEPSNINRQQYFMDQIGMYKVDALLETLQRISPLTQVNFKKIKVSEENSSSLFIGCDIIIEAFDNKLAKAMLFNAWLSHYSKQDVYYIGASGVAGYKDDYPITIKKMGENAYIIGDMVTEASVGMGLMAPRVGIAANMQANLAVNLLMKKYYDNLTI